MEETKDPSPHDEQASLNNSKKGQDRGGSPPRTFTTTSVKIPDSPLGNVDVTALRSESASASSTMAVPPPLVTTANAPRILDSPAGGPQQQQLQQSQHSINNQDFSPAASPSSISISSKTTIRTGPAAAKATAAAHSSLSNIAHAAATTAVAGSSAEPFLPPASSLDSSLHSMMDGSSGPATMGSPALLSAGGSSSIMRSPLLTSKASGGGLVSPKMSPTGTASSRKNSGSRTTQSSSSAQQQQQQQSTQQQQQHHIFSKLDHPPLPLPRKARRCPLFCCFYAEFDNVVGPKVCYESPKGFMEQNSDVSLKEIHKLLASNFDRILSEQNGPIVKSTKKEKDATSSEEAQAGAKPVKGQAKVTPDNSSSAAAVSPSNSCAAAALAHPPAIKGAKSGDDSVGTMLVTNTTSSIATPVIGNSTHRKQPPPPLAVDTITSQASTTSTSTANNNNTTTSSKEPSSSKTDGGGSGSAAASIFESTCDFIITGSELTGNIVNLSAFNMHLLTRPTIIHDKRYERNSLLFCVGFILRRTEDPRPFRPLLSKLALSLKRMEMESSFLSKQHTRRQIQPLLDRILVSLNCTQWETNLVVHNTVLNLKLFHPPKYPASPVKDHSVPILLRRDWQVQMYDWDLAINWVVLHIDGVANARQISKKAEVDMEMVRNCLRVLKHHGVISVVDMFFYSNRYEPTKRAAAVLAGHEPALLQEAAEYVLKRPASVTTPTNHMIPYNSLAVPLSPPPSASPERSVHHHYHHHPVNSPGGSPILPSSFPPELGGDNAAAVSSSLLGSSLKYHATIAASYQSQDPQFFGALRREEQRELKTALAELYSACNRDMSFGDLWVAFAAGRGRSYSFDRSVERNRSNSDSRDPSSRHSQQQQQQQTNSNNNGAYQNYSLARGDSLEISGSEGTGEQQGDTTDLASREYYLERLKRKSACAGIDWRAMFDMFDHRRFVSFGLVNGLLNRVHNFPFVLDTCAASIKREFAFEGRHSSVPVDESILQARNVAKMMDGLHCDDHIVSVFQKPINSLIDMVEKVEGKKVLSTYSVADNCG